MFVFSCIERFTEALRSSMTKTKARDWGTKNSLGAD
jgi:hypothetical protein